LNPELGDLEGVRSLGAVLAEASFVLLQQGLIKIWKTM
jgi:hypothetical protein